MRVLFASTAGAGHIGPLVPFARACAGAGHEVRVAAPESAAAVVGKAGLAHVPLPDASPASVGAVFARVPRLSLRAADELVVREVFGRVGAEAVLPAMRATVASWRPDVVVREPAEVSSHVVAAQQGVPQVQVNIGLDSFLDKLDVLDEPLAALGAERGAAGLREVPRWTSVPPSFDLLASGAVVGPRRFRDPSAAAPASSALPPWWPGGTDPLVYVTFGSVAAGLGLYPRFYAAVLAALADAPVRVLLTLGEAGSPEDLGTLPPNAHVERWWPQAELMPHVAAVLGHGGFGTTLLALTAGVPQVVVPLFSSDQFDNAGRVAATGAGLALLDSHAVERRAGEVLSTGPEAVRDVRDAVLRAVHDGQLRVGAQRLADEIGRLDDVAECATALLEVVR